ncbi:hypothetical protein OS493_027949 [Desmophyllum pertusum]|uniref:Tetratricopeptide repeat protein n=1 Tax=Desmophyllum pertusum TaxID=174260 RepID=A0A9W9Y9B1_9CNID|nr:hypothetical protein OS493_027949 [Desmophyllum pertusum]
MDNVEEILQALFIGIAVASVLLQTYRYSKAIELFSECLVLLKKHSTKLKKEKLNEIYALVYRRLFSLYCLVGNYKNAIQSGEKALPLYHQIGDSESAAGLLDKIGDVYQSTGEQVNAKESYEKAFALYRNEVTTKIGDKEIVGGLLQKLGDLSLSLFEYPQAKDYFQRELAIWKETGCQTSSCNYCIMDDVEEILQALFVGIAVASVLFQTYRYSKAIELFSECLVLLKKHSTKLKKDKLSELYALVYRRLFSLYCLVGDYKNAIQSGEKALPFYHQIGDSVSAAGLLDKIGDVYQSTGERVKAKESYEKAIALYCNEMDKVFEMPFVKQREHFERMLSVETKIGDKEIVGGLLHKLGDLSLSLFEYPQAKDYFQRELAIWKETGNRKNEGRTLNSFGKVYREMEEYEQAKQHYEEAMAILEEAGEIKELGVTCGELGKVCKTLREFQKQKHCKRRLSKLVRKSGTKMEKSEITDTSLVSTSLWVNA